LKRPELGKRFFLDIVLVLLCSWGKLFAIFFGLKFRAFAFALACSHAPSFLRSFSRSSIFCSHTFALLDFGAHNFVLVRLYMARTGQPEQVTQNSKGHPEQDSQNRTARTGQPEQDSQNKTARTGQQERDKQNKTGLTGGQDRTART
jgi:hypothetical protein